jgi:nicotinamidase-related amidase
MPASRYTGVENLLAPENCALLLIDHQPSQLASVQNIDRTLLINNVVGLAKTAKVFGVPTVLSTVLEERGGFLFKDVQDVFPDQKTINRTTLNAWETRASSRRSRRRGGRSSWSPRSGPKFVWRTQC